MTDTALKNGKNKNMKKIMKRSKEYYILVDQIVHKLRLWQDILEETCVLLAMEGQWKEWSDSQSINTQISVDDKMLYETNDKNIELLLNIKNLIVDSMDLFHYRKDEISKLSKDQMEILGNIKNLFEKNIEDNENKSVTKKKSDRLNSKTRCWICNRKLDSFYSDYKNPVCRKCEENAQNIDGNFPVHYSLDDYGDNPVFINGIKCWRRYKFGGFITMADEYNCVSIEEFMEKNRKK